MAIPALEQNSVGGILFRFELRCLFLKERIIVRLFIYVCMYVFIYLFIYLFMRLACHNHGFEEVRIKKKKCFQQVRWKIVL